MSKVIVKQVRSDIGRSPAVRQTIKALGLGRLNKQKELPLNDAVKGMIKKVDYLLEVTPAK
jgi:large subunit ribosomal protein L30